MKNRDLFGSLFWMGFGVPFIVGALQHGLVREGVPGPGFLPFTTGIILISLSFMVLIPALSNRKIESGVDEKTKFFPERDSLKKISLALISLFAYGFSLKYAGYLLTTFLFMLFIPRLVKTQRWRIVFILALLTAMLSYLLFVVFLELNLPSGILDPKDIKRVFKWIF